VGRSSVIKCVWRDGMDDCRNANQCADRRVRREPLDGIPWWMD